HEAGLVEFTNPDFVAYAKACGAQGYRVETLAEFEQAFKAAVASGKPTLIDAMITRLAIPHYSPNPAGVLAPIGVALVKERGAIWLAVLPGRWATGSRPTLVAQISKHGSGHA